LPVLTNPLANGSRKTEDLRLSETEQPFVHLRVHSAYSLLEGALTIPHLVTLAAEQRMPALALTDTNNQIGRAHV